MLTPCIQDPSAYVIGGAVGGVVGMWTIKYRWQILDFAWCLCFVVCQNVKAKIQQAKQGNKEGKL